jgi:hypothetical protein
VDTVEGALLVAKNAVSSKLNNERNGHLSEDERSEPNEAAANAGPSEASNKRRRLSDVAANPRPSKTHRLATPEPETPVHVGSNVTKNNSPTNGGLGEYAASDQRTKEPSDSSDLSEASKADEGTRGTRRTRRTRGTRGTRGTQKAIKGQRRS